MAARAHDEITLDGSKQSVHVQVFTVSSTLYCIYWCDDLSSGGGGEPERAEY